MADLLSILSQGATSLGAHRASTATASHNLENANTPGYARQRANLEATLPSQFIGNAFVGRGVNLNTISQARDRFLEAQVPGALASAARTDAESVALQSVHALDPELAGGVGESLAAFFTALRALSQNPGSGVLRQGLLDVSKTLAQSFNRTATAIDQARDGLDSKIDGLVTQVNSMAQRMAELNRSIRTARANGAEPNDLLDARQRLQDDLATLAGATPVPNAQGDVSMVLASGTALVSEDHAATLSVLPDPTNRGHLAIEITLADGTGPIPVNLTSGTLGGVLDARDVSLRNAEDSLDQLAYDFGNALNGVHQAGFALDGSTGHDLFTVSATALGAATTLVVDAAVAGNPDLLAASSTAAGVPGDGTNVFALIALEDSPLSTGRPAEGTLSRIIADFGSATQRAEAMAAQELALRDSLISMRESASGVSIDEEMVEMTRAQRAYEAVSKVITTADQMLDTLMKLR